MPLYSAAERASLVQQLQKADQTYDDVRADEEHFARQLELTSIVADLSARDVCTLGAELASVDSTGEEASFLRHELCKETSRLTVFNDKAQHAKHRYLKTVSDADALAAKICRIEKELDEWPSGPYAKRQALHRRQNRGSGIAFEWNSNVDASGLDIDAMDLD